MDVLIKLAGPYGLQHSNHKVEQVSPNHPLTHHSLLLFVNEISITGKMYECLQVIISGKMSV